MEDNNENALPAQQAPKQSRPGLPLSSAVHWTPWITLFSHDGVLTYDGSKLSLTVEGKQTFNDSLSEFDSIDFSWTGYVFIVYHSKKYKLAFYQPKTIAIVGIFGAGTLVKGAEIAKHWQEVLAGAPTVKTANRRFLISGKEWKVVGLVLLGTAIFVLLVGLVSILTRR